MMPFIIFEEVVKPEDCEHFAAQVSFDEGHILANVVSYVAAAANAHYGFDIRSMEAPAKVEVESADWHSDFLIDVNPLVRKLTAILTLKDEAKGGDLGIKDLSGKPFLLTKMRAEGTMVVFPSILHYRFTDLKKGSRTIVRTFFIGPPFK